VKNQGKTLLNNGYTFKNEEQEFKICPFRRRVLLGQGRV
jgi:hypothetical protein